MPPRFVYCQQSLGGRSMANAQSPRTREFLVLRDAQTHTHHDVLLPDSDIDAHIEFSYSRSIFYLIGILLVLTDIPRTGLSTDVKRAYGAVAPSTSMYYGPFEYHMAHLVRDDWRVVNGSCSGSPIDAVEVWVVQV
ncbi:hypothetical protein PINS_up023534 [Pythium insidiosum]|nr:hypothetical protein PINS_up023534 [Pythium insidiosum]